MTTFYIFSIIYLPEGGMEMILSLYLLSIVYTNSMGLIIISKCNPFINKEIENKGYLLKEKEDKEFLQYIIKNCLLFLIPGYFLKKALTLANKDADIDSLIDEKLKKNEIVTINKDETTFDSIFKRDNEKLSIGKYDKVIPYKATSLEESMYTKERYSNSEDVDMDFWEEEEKDLKPYLEEETIEEKQVIKKEPMQEYLSSISEEELESMAKQLELIRKLKKDSEMLLNNKSA